MSGATRPAIRGRLARCEGCGLTDALCLCAALVPIAVRTRVVIVAHRDEITKPSNTGRLAARLLDGAELHVRGKSISERDASPSAGARRLVLFPTPGARTLSPDDALGDPVVLVVPDGSWAQAEKITRREPRADGAEPIALPAGPPTRYGLRRNEREGGLCTIEAIARALSVLEGARGGAIERQLLDVLELFVARQRSVRLGGLG